MASAVVVDCRPLRDTGNIAAAGTGALASLRTAPDAVPQSPTAVGAANATGQRTPGSARGKGQSFNVQLYGAEAVGRKCSVMQSRSGAKAWEKAQVLEYNVELSQHKLRYNSTKSEEWVFLADLKFKWSHVLPPTALANPTYKPEYAGEAGVGKRVRVYWPAMQRWYQGTVKAYDAKSDKHTVLYKDGDSQHLVLKHEPVIWCDDEPAANGTSSGTEQPQQGQRQHPGQQQPTASTPRHSNSTVTTPRGGATPRGGVAAGTAAAFAAGRPGVGGHPARALSPRSPVSPRSTSVTAAAALAASFAGTVSRLAKAGVKSGAAGTGAARAATSAKAAAGAGKSHNTAANGMNGSALAHARSTAGAAAVAAAAAASRQQQQGPGPGRAGITLGKHARDSAGGQGDSAAKRLRRLQSRVSAAAATTAAGRLPVVTADKHLAVGCRVGVYWRLDKVFYRGKLVSYSPQSGKYTVKYDDGQSEALLLEKERFVWHCPRALSAGYKPALHTLMQQLGADALKPLPQMGDDGKVVAVTPGPEGAPHPPMSGPGAVGWRIKLYWAADQDWHEAEVLSHDEVRRQHHLLYLDGEEEWADLARENVVWLKATRHGAISAGVVTGDDVPKGRDAVGWRVAVYWKDDRTFYEGELMDYEASTGRHKVLYNDGEEEWLALRNERVVWRLAPKDESDESSDDDGTDLEGLGSEDADVVGMKRGSRTRRRGGKRRLMDPEHTRSDSGSASSGLGRAGTFRTTADDGMHSFLADAGAAGDLLAAAGGAAAGSAAAHAGDRVIPQGSCVGGLAAAGGDSSYHNTLHSSLRRGPGGNVTMKGRGSGPPPTGLGSKVGQGLLNRQGSSAGPAAGAGFGGNVLKGGIGNPNLPPLQLKRISGSGDGLGSPTEAAQAAEQMQLLVRIVPGGGGRLGASPAAATAAGDAGSAAGAAVLPPALQKLPVRQQRAAARLQRKMDRLHMILGKLAATAGSMGWKLDPQQLPSALLPPAGANGDLTGPKSPKARGNKAAVGIGPTSPRGWQGPMSPRVNGTVARAASSSAAAGPTSPRANGLAGKAAGLEAGPTSPRAAASPTAAGRTVAVHKTCAVKSKPPGLLQQQQQAGNGALNGTRPLKMRALLDVPTQPVVEAAASAPSAPIAAASAGDAAGAAVPAQQPPPPPPQQQQSVQPGVTAPAAPAIRAAQIPSAVPQHTQQQQQQTSAAQAAKLQQQQQQQQQPPKAAVSTGAVPATSGAAGAGAAAAPASKPASPPADAAAKPAVVPAAVSVVPPAAVAAAAAAAASAPAAPTVHAMVPAVVAVPAAMAAAAAGTALKAPVAATVPAVVAVPVTVAAAVSRSLPSRALPPSLPNVSNPSAPSAHMTADDVVLKLQAMAGLQASSGPALQQQLQQLAAAQAAAAASAGSTGSGQTASAAKKPAATAAAAAAASTAAAPAGADAADPDGAQAMETD